MNSVEDFASQSIKKRSNYRSIESGSLLGEGKLLIELKIPKDGGEHVVMVDTEDQNKHRVCDICNKTFRSGKALGGHMRIHSQKRREKSLICKNKLKPHQSVKFKKQNPRAKVDTKVTSSECEQMKIPTVQNHAGGVDIDERPTCPVCRRVFPSLKSMFGHMRKHSNRNWRGSRPPSIQKTSSCSCLSYEENLKKSRQNELLAHNETDGGIDLTEYLRGWSSTARRGCNELKELEAAAGLMMLMGEDSGLVHRQKDDQFENARSKPGLGEPSLRGRDQVEEKGYAANLNDDFKNLGSMILIKNKKKRKNVKVFDLQQPHNESKNPSKQMEETKENDSNLVETTICNKSLSSQDIYLSRLPNCLHQSEVEVGCRC